MKKIPFQNFGTQKNWINGRYMDSNSSNTIAVISPYYDKEIATVPESNFEDLDQTVQIAKKIFIYEMIFFVINHKIFYISYIKK